MNGNSSDHHEEVGVFQVVVLLLTIVVLGALLVDTAFKLPSDISKILEWIDTGVCFLLLIDFGLRFHKAESKLQFLKWGWIDLIASIPNLPIFRVGRLVRLLRIIRLLRAIRASQRVSSILFRNKIHGGIASIFVTFVLFIMFSSIGILVCEQSAPNAKIKTAEDSIWWSVATITTVGYGDLYPVTNEGRLLAMALMISGVGMFGAVSGVVATALIGDNKKDTAERSEIIERLKKLEEKIDSLKRDQKSG
jgi:voltage-gated potassium channel